MAYWDDIIIVCAVDVEAGAFSRVARKIDAQVSICWCDRGWPRMPEDECVPSVADENGDMGGTPADGIRRAYNHGAAADP